MSHNVNVDLADDVDPITAFGEVNNLIMAISGRVVDCIGCAILKA